MAMPPKWPCDECGAKRNETHAPSCSRSQNRRKPGFGRLPRSQQRKYTAHRHNPRPVKGREKNGTNYYECSICRKKLGRW